MSSNLENKIHHSIFKALTNSKVLVIFGVLNGLSSYLLLTSERFSYLIENEFNISALQTGLLLAVFSIVAITLLYLQSGEVKSENDSEIRIKYLLEEIKKTELKIASLAERVEHNDLTDSREMNFAFTTDERKEIINDIVAKAGEDAINSLFETKAKQFHDDLKKSIIRDRLTDSFRRVVNRLEREISDLRLRSNVNLVLGMAITGGGLYLLWSTVAMLDSSDLLKALASEGSESNAQFFKNFLLPLIPRISLVIFIEIFAYFFLRLYKNGLSEIKYFQNELTNIESKMISAEFSYLSQNQESLKYALDALSRTERNFVLEKNQTTVELEKAKSESELTRNIVKSMPLFIKNFKK